jgi:putative hydrolase of HD superfamily
MISIERIYTLDMVNDFLRQLEFIKEADKLKSVIRRNYLLDGSRFENTAEHSWHAALTAFILKDQANHPVNIDKVIRMLIFHDVIEIKAGDTCMFYPEAEIWQYEREVAAADELFGMLPSDQGDELRNLWLEFEERETPEAKFAKAIDRFMPMLANYESGGKAWKDEHVSAARLREINAIIKDGCVSLWKLTQDMIDDAVVKGLVE